MGSLSIDKANETLSIFLKDIGSLKAKVEQLEAENKKLKSSRIGEVRTVLMEELGYKIDALEAENKALKSHIAVCVRESGEFYDQNPKDDREALDIFKKAFEL